MRRKNYKNKPANEWASIHVNNNLRIQIVQPEFATWKYNVKLRVEAASGGV